MRAGLANRDETNAILPNKAMVCFLIFIRADCDAVEKMVDLVGIEPTTSSMPWKRAPSCATGPRRNSSILADWAKIVKLKVGTETVHTHGSENFRSMELIA